MHIFHMKIIYDMNGGGTTTSVDIPDSEIAECKSLDEALAVIDEWVQEDFNQKVFPDYDASEYETEIEALIKAGNEA